MWNFCQIWTSSPPPHRHKAPPHKRKPPIDDFLATVLLYYSYDFIDSKVLTSILWHYSHMKFSYRSRNNDMRAITGPSNLLTHLYFQLTLCKEWHLKPVVKVLINLNLELRQRTKRKKRHVNSTEVNVKMTQTKYKLLACYSKAISEKLISAACA